MRGTELTRRVVAIEFVGPPAAVERQITRAQEMGARVFETESKGGILLGKVAITLLKNKVRVEQQQ